MSRALRRPALSTAPLFHTASFRLSAASGEAGPALADLPAPEPRPTPFGKLAGAREAPAAHSPPSNSPVCVSQPPTARHARPSCPEPPRPVRSRGNGSAAEPRARTHSTAPRAPRTPSWPLRAHPAGLNLRAGPPSASPRR